MPSQICGFKDGAVKWFDGGRLPAGWSHEDPTLKKESLPGDVQPGDGDGTLKGSDPDVDPDGEDFDADGQPNPPEVTEVDDSGPCQGSDPGEEESRTSKLKKNKNKK